MVSQEGSLRQIPDLHLPPLLFGHGFIYPDRLRDKTAHTTQRIQVVDCLRGFALFGLFIVHMVEYFELFWYAPEWGWVHDTVFFLFGGKAYAIFALLFGLSFFIIMDKQERRGIDFRGRFAWRLALLLAMGLLHQLLYSGDILQVLALSGFLLVLIYPLSSKSILLLAGICILQVPLLAHLALLAAGMIEGGPPLHWAIMGDTFAIYANGSFAEVVQRNMGLGLVGKWLFAIESGRLWNMIGLFLVGFVLGRARFFENYREKLPLCFAALAACLFLLGIVHVCQALVTASALAGDTSRLAGEILGNYSNNLLTVAGVLLFLLVYELRWPRKLMDLLAPSGRMSLTVYLTQSLYGIPLFYGFGMGLYQGFGQVNALLLGLALWLVQMAVAHAWMKRYHYGPFEWLWRAATYRSLGVPWRKKSSPAH